MAYDVKLLSLAAFDLNEICVYKSQFYPGTVQKFLDEYEKTLINLAENPRIYPRYPYNETFRRAVADDYLVFYRINDENNRVNIYRILHGMRDISKLL